MNPSEIDQTIVQLQEANARGDFETLYNAALRLHQHDPQNQEYASIFRNIDKILMIRRAEDFFEKIAGSKEKSTKQDYKYWLSWFHKILEPRLYLEIGIETGQTLSLAGENTLIIGVDPEPQIKHQLNGWSKIYKMTSDQFFNNINTIELFRNQLDLVFIDGLHTFDQVMRDFNNTEKNALKETIIIFHDVLPVEKRSALRERETLFWLGDVWKFILILDKYRPDLKFFTIPAFPSGLLVVFDLKQDLETLSNKHNQITEEFMPMQFENENIELLYEKANICANDEVSVLKAFE